MKKTINFSRKHFYIFLFALALLFPFTVTALKYFSTNETYVYVRVKVSQGLWWASTERPKIWLRDSLAPGDRTLNLTGKEIAKVLKVESYHYNRKPPEETRYDIFVTLKLLVNKSGQKYLFNRDPVVAGAPLELELSKTYLTGSIVALSESEFSDETVTKVVTLVKKLTNFNEYALIRPGDYYSNGSDKVFEVLGKYQAGDKLYVTAKIKAVKNSSGNLIFGYEQVLVPGSIFDLATNNFDFNEFYIYQIQ